MKTYEKVVKNKLIELIEEKKKYYAKIEANEQMKNSNTRNLADYCILKGKELFYRKNISLLEHKILLLNEIISNVDIMEIGKK